jgi:thiosulfate/3-mercaptopyruvate sulfurtransferase
LFFSESVFAYDIQIISPDALNRNLSKWIILDARPVSQWETGHIPQALSFYWEEYTRVDAKKIPYRVWPADKLAEALGKMGLNEKSPVVVYGDADTSWGGEGWVCWVLTWLGHQGPIRLLEGGIQAWEKKGYLITKGRDLNTMTATVYTTNPRPEVLINTKTILEHPSDVYLIDTRSIFEWVRGHLPGAVHIEWKKFYNKKEKGPINPVAFNNLLKKHNIGTDKPIIYYCTGGVRSGYAWMVHQLSGKSLAKNYEGGTAAWDRRKP